MVYEPRSYKRKRELVRHYVLDILLTCLELSALPRCVGLGYSADNATLFNRAVGEYVPYGVQVFVKRFVTSDCTLKIIGGRNRVVDA